jgi:hypothetical protein
MIINMQPLDHPEKVDFDQQVYRPVTQGQYMMSRAISFQRRGAWIAGGTGKDTLAFVLESRGLTEKRPILDWIYLEGMLEGVTLLAERMLPLLKMKELENGFIEFYLGDVIAKAERLQTTHARAFGKKLTKEQSDKYASIKKAKKDAADKGLALSTPQAVDSSPELKHLSFNEKQKLINAYKQFERRQRLNEQNEKHKRRGK